jgi:hypothetical protein
VLNSGEIIITLISGGVPPYEILWSTGSTEDAITGLEPGIFWVDITDGNGCTRRDSFELKRTTDVRDLELTGIRIYPNPFGPVLIIEDQKSREIHAQLFDLAGRECSSWTLNGDGSHTLVVPDKIASGFYYLRIFLEDKPYVVPLVRSR